MRRSRSEGPTLYALWKYRRNTTWMKKAARRTRQVGEETCKGEEGCLSFPGITAPIERSFRIHLSYQDLGAEQCELELKGFVARVVQHEVDHLNGVLFIDRMTRVKKVALSGRLKRMRRETQQRMGLV